MASLFPAIIHYKQEFVPNDNVKQTQLERTVNAHKQKNQIPQAVHWRQCQDVALHWTTIWRYNGISSRN